MGFHRMRILGQAIRTMAAVICLGVFVDGIAAEGRAVSKIPRPEDARAWFDGEELSGLANPGRWEIADGVITMPGYEKRGRLQSTDDDYENIELYVEWLGVPGERCNSGVFFGEYEVQILNNYEEPAPSPDAMAAGIYGQYWPYVDASLPPDEWNNLAILFQNAEFADDGELLKPARVTTLHNGVVVQHDRILLGAFGRRWVDGRHTLLTEYQPHGSNRISFQEHGSAVSFRNIWLRDAQRSAETEALREIDLARMHKAKADPKHQPRSRLQPNPPKVNPYGEGGRPTDAKPIGAGDLAGSARMQDGKILLEGPAEWETDIRHGQLRVEWTSDHPLPVSILGQHMELDTRPGEENRADIAFTAGSVGNRTRVSVTAWVNGTFQQRRAPDAPEGATRLSIGSEGTRHVVSTLWVRDLE